MASSLKILLVEDMESLRQAVAQLLGVFHDIDEVADLASARRCLRNNSYDAVILDKGLPDGDGISLISEIKELHPNCVVIILTSDADFGSVKHCISRGIDDYVLKSAIAIPDISTRLQLALMRKASDRKLASLEESVKEAYRHEIMGKSQPTLELRETVYSLKGSNSHVLITGESGTGKELIARRLNAIEADDKRPFIAVNCGAIPENLVESELFGHKKGAFTGANNERHGKFELAHKGDLFLDEIGELPLAAQVKLLRVIQEGECSRVGDDRVIRVECRIIAATNRDLVEMVKAGKFREDLYHRLNVIQIETTPLRKRLSDIPDIVQSFLLQIGGSNYKITDHAINALKDYDWPGNIRELRNSVERAIISARRRQSCTIDYGDIVIQQNPQDKSSKMRKLEAGLPQTVKELNTENYESFLASAEREYLASALAAANDDVTELASLLGIGRSTLFKRLAKLGIGPAEAKPIHRMYRSPAEGIRLQ